MDKATAKAAQLKGWQAVAPGWNKWEEFFGRITKPVTDRFLAEVRPGQRVLDIASGVGEPAISIARKVGPGGSVLGTDLVEEMIAFARGKATAHGVTNVVFRCVDGEVVDVPAGSFDVVSIRWGLMFMPDPEACLRSAHRALRKGGRIVLSCWAAPQKNLWASGPIDVLKRYVDMPPPPPGAPGLFALADPARLQSALEASGFSDIAIEEVELFMADFATGAEYWTFVLEIAGPIATMFAKVAPEKREEAAGEVIREIERIGGGSARLRGITWVATARA
jgi:SAM-dependent methyltransferase